MRSALAHGLDGAGTALDLHLDLDVFHGPFDLLVTLILREEIDLWEVRVSRIIAEYVVRLADSGDFDLEATSQFIVLVAALLELKSRLLLPGEGDEGLDEIGGEEAGEQLLDALVRYAQFKAAAATLRGRHAAHAGRLYRRAPVPAQLLQGGLEPGALKVADLAAALVPLLREPLAPDVSHIADLAVSVVRELRRLRALLARRESFSFAAVAPRDRLHKALTFFALLELHNAGEVVLAQASPLADITVTRRPAAALAR